MPRVERTDEDELDERGDDRAHDETEERACEEAPAGRVDSVEEVRRRPPRPVAADGDERAVREVEDAHEPVDEREPGRDQEVHRAEAEAGDGEQHERAHACPTLSSCFTSSGCASSSFASPVYTTRPWSSTTALRAIRRTTPEVLLDEQHRRQLREPLEDARDFADERGREALRRLVDEQHAVVVQQRPRDRDHLLLAARERARALPSALLELGEELVHEVVARLRVALGEAEILGHGEAGEDVAVLGHVADAAADDLMRRLARELLVREPDGAVRADEAEDRAERRRLADAVAAEQRGDAPFGDVEGEVLQDVRLPVVDVQVADGEERPRRDRRTHSSSPRYADCTVSFAITAAGVSHASSAPWCITAIRWAIPVTTSM